MPDVPVNAAQRWLRNLRFYTRPRMLLILILSAVAGQQYPLLFTTLQAWFHDASVDVATVTQLTWIGALFSLKFLWAPLLDNVRLPLLHRLLGKRRSWLLLCEVGIIIGLAGMAFHDPNSSRLLLILYALVTAFSAATHDIALDAYRIELSSAPDEQTALASTYIIGYRLGMLVGGAGALIIGAQFGWSAAYFVMALITAVGLLAVLLSKPPHETITTDELLPKQVERLKDKPSFYRALAFLYSALIQPLVEFFCRYKGLGVLLLAMICVYRLSDQTMGSLAMPLYQNAGFSAAQIGSVSKVFGVLMTLLGGIVGSLLTSRYGVFRLLVVGTLLASVTNLMYILVALSGTEATMHYIAPGGALGSLAAGVIAMLIPLADLLHALGVTPLMLLATTIAADNLASGIAGTVLVGFFASLTSRHYTATQAALFSSLMTLPGKLLGGFIGLYVDLYGYPISFFMSTLIGLPALLLAIAVYIVARPIQQRSQQEDDD
ncbi:AmpG family muropeptide MFS transporter [Zymobacter palmae]|nr:MFS transporter [Zymobacter palmae]